ncbi:MAG: helix-turn-helix domain-containing protein [Alphaproteobacteria bacterium]|nr:helix-turn-helix domain-containing protein [Alphaproteobacteria bacterium]
MVSPSQIRAARALIGAKQSDLARAAGISLATLNNIERAVGDPRSSTLDAIENALISAGIDFAQTAVSETVTLRLIDRPAAYETLFASQRLLELLGPDSLMRVESVLVFARRSRPDPDGDTAPVICLLIEGRNRSVLFDQVQFSVANGSRAAEMAAILLWAFRFHGASLSYLAQILDDTTAGDASEVAARLRGLNWLPLNHPAEFFDLFDDWEGRLMGYAARDGHPMKDLAALFEDSVSASQRA